MKPKLGTNIDYLYYYMTSSQGQKQIFNKIKGAGQATVTIEDIRKMTIPIPSDEEQQRIVDILNKFNVLCNDLTQGLPAEIE